MTAPQVGRADGATLSDLVSELGNDLSTLVRKEMELAREEMKTEASRAARAGALMGAGGVLGLDALLLLLFAAAWALAGPLPAGLAFLIVAVLVGMASALVVRAGRARLQGVSPVPEQTVSTLKEDKQWLTQLRN